MDHLESLSPSQRLIRVHRQGVRRIASMRVPMFGLPAGWAGTRMTGANEVQTGVTRDDAGVHGEWNETVELLHQSGQSMLSVCSSSVPASIDDVALEELLGGRGRCAPMTVELSGDRVAFAAAFGDDDWVARWVGYQATVTVRGHLWPVRSGLELVLITDLSAYHEGRLVELEERSGLDLRG